MVLDTLHKTIIQTAWVDVEAILATDAGRKMVMVCINEDFPLHMAIERNAPESIILSMLKIFPDAATHVGRHGSTPLHMAAQRNLSLSTIVALIRVCPEVLDQQDSKGRLACDYARGKDLCREALLRPTACWIEDVEKEEYYEKVNRRKAQLAQNIQLLSDGIISSRKSQESLKMYINKLEPRLETQRTVLAELVDIHKQISEMYDSSRESIDKMRERIRVLSDEAAKEPDEEDIMLRSYHKRTFMERVQRQYEKLLLRTEQVRNDLQMIRVLAERERRSEPNSTREERS